MSAPRTEFESESAVAAEREQRLAEVLDEYLANLEGGLPPDVDGLLADHPEFAEELQVCLESLHMVHRATHGLRAARGPSRTESQAPRSKRVGEYTLVREIGRGGMGIVYEAHQDSLNRRVALKILPFAAVLDQRQIARFRNEAQAAAQLHHPHIVPVFAVGQERGVYYYAMQFIEGRSLDEVLRLQRYPHESQLECSERNCGGMAEQSTIANCGPEFPTRGSIRNQQYFHAVARLGVQAAEALGHAHDVGIVHRDIKPSNLLLDQHGKLWVTDFGLARIQSEKSVTLSGDVVGTLRYMSPEQAAGRTGLVDARTDIYSLGSTLYELLTLEAAVQGDDRHSMMRQLERESLTPIRQLNHAVPIDLETIVLQAMASSPQDRYATAQQLADDLKRYLAGEPTLARRPTAIDRASRWTRRHRSLVAIAAASFFIISILSTVGFVMMAAERARTRAALRLSRSNAEEAEENLARAEEHFRQARDVVDRFGIRTADRLVDVPGAEQLRQNLLAETLGYYRRFVEQAGNDPQLRDELALAHYKSAMLSAKLGHPDVAVQEYHRAQTLLQSQLATGGTEESATLSQLALVHNNLGLLWAGRGELSQARQQYKAAAAIGDRLAHLERPDFINQQAEIQANLGMLLNDMGDEQAALTSLRAAIQRLEALANSPSVEHRYVRNLAICLNNLSHLQRQHDLVAAEKTSRRAVQILSEVVAAHPNDETSQSDLALCWSNLATILSQTEQLSPAVDCYRRAIEIQSQMARKAPSVVRCRSELAISLNNLGVVYCRAATPELADEAFSRARHVFQTLVDDYPQHIQFSSGLAALLNNQGLALVKADRSHAALPIYDAAVAAQRSVVGRVANPASANLLLSRILVNLGRAHLAAAQPRQTLDTMLAQRELCGGDAERLFRVTLQLVKLLESLASQSGELADLRSRTASEAVRTLADALAAGYEPVDDLRNDERLACLRECPEFDAAISNQRSSAGRLETASRR